MLGMRKVRTERFLAKRRVALTAVLLVLPLVAGCPQEVPYASPERGATEGETPTAEQPATDEAPAFTPRDGAEEPAETAAAPAETAASEPAEAPTRSMPWDAAGKPAAAPEEAGDLFAAVDKPAETPAKPQAASDENEKEEGDDFGAFLDEAYGAPAKEDPAAMTAEAEPQQDTQPQQETQPQPAVEPEVTEELAATTPAATEPIEEPKAAADDDWWGKPADEAPTTESPLAESPVADTPPAKTTPEPKVPSAAASSNADLLDELWGEDSDKPAETKEEDPPAPVPAAQPPAEKVETSEAPTLPRDEPAPPADAGSLFDEPEAEAEQPEPLPAVPVLEFNTRHLAWLLGGKLGLAELADLDGATASEVAEWRSEVARLSKSLKIADPSTGGAAANSDERVEKMLQAASRAGAELTRAHGVDHAALMEIALKSNALLVVAKDHPDLAGSVGRAIEGAAQRAMLPKFLWEDSVRVLKASPDADQAHDAVVRLHQRVESFLR